MDERENHQEFFSTVLDERSTTDNFIIMTIISNT